MTTNPKAQTQHDLIQQIATNLANVDRGWVATNPGTLSEFLRINRQMLFNLETELDAIAAHMAEAARLDAVAASADPANTTSLERRA